MEPIILAASLVAGGLLLAALGLCRALSQALQSYSRSLLEDLCEAKGHPDRPQEIAHEGTRTQRGAEALALVAGLVLVLLFWWLLSVETPERYRRPAAVGAVLLAGIVHLIAVAYGRVHAEKFLDAAWKYTGAIRVLGWPWLALTRFAESRFRGADPDAPASAARPASVEVEIAHSDEDEEGELEAELSETTRDRMENLVRLDHTTVEQVMTPRASLVILPATATIDDAARAFVASGRSRIPLYGESRDDIVGILYFKDLIPELAADKDRASIQARGLARPSFWVPETKNAAELLDELRGKRVQIAIVLDEFGALAGAVTIEDLIEVIIGPIDDEHDIPTPDDEIVPLSADSYQVDGATALTDLNDRLDLKLPTEEDFQTVGGLAFNALGRIPVVGDTFRAHGVAFTVLEVSDRTIKLLRLDLNPAPATGTPAG